jgi:hypothetical protein
MTVRGGFSGVAMTVSGQSLHITFAPMSHRILFLSYWGANEGLSQATVLPHVLILANRPDVEQVVYVSIERKPANHYQVPEHPAVQHVPLRANRFRFRLLNKLFETLWFGRKLTALAKQERISLVVCRSSLAGNWGLTILRKTGIPFAVESFEPHAEYMRELGIWKKYGLSYRFQTRSENKQKQRTFRLFPVSEHYRQVLTRESLPAEKIITLPCAVDADAFAYRPEERETIRHLLGILPSDCVGIYVGKFGGIYLELTEAMQWFKESFDALPDLHILLLTPDDPERIQQTWEASGLPAGRLHIRFVSHQEVPGWLSVADFAFSLIKSTPMRLYCSAIKHGEYWANGLPVLMPDGIGDDSELNEREKGGITLKNNSIKEALGELLPMIEDHECRKRIPEIAKDHRSFQLTRMAYDNLLRNLNGK